MLAPTNVKRSHHVAQEYLRTFAKSADRIRVTDLDGKPPFVTSVANAAVESRYYEVETSAGQLSAESWLTEVEGEAWPVIRRLITDPAELTALTGLEEEFLARYIAAQWLRVPAMRHYHEGKFRSFVKQAKRINRDSLRGRYEPVEAERIWAEWERMPDEWFLGEDTPFDEPELTVSMLGEVQGFANLLRAAPWRAGCVPGHLPLYTSDNPVSRFFMPVHRWYDMGQFLDWDYFVPLSPSVLLKIGRRREIGDEFPGPRRHRDFTAWESSFARHLVTREAVRFLYGEGPVVPRDCAMRCLSRIEAAMRWSGEWLGWPERYQPRGPSIRRRLRSTNHAS